VEPLNRFTPLYNAFQRNRWIRVSEKILEDKRVPAYLHTIVRNGLDHIKSGQPISSKMRSLLARIYNPAFCFCGKPSMYKVGTLGYCKPHYKELGEKKTKAFNQVFTQRSHEYDKFRAEFDERDRQRTNIKKAKHRRKQN
jgi:hypothetical protein